MPAHPTRRSRISLDGQHLLWYPDSDDELPNDPVVQSPESFTTRLIRVGTVCATCGALVSIPSLIAACFVPLVTIFALPALFIICIFLLWAIAQIAYLFFAQTDAPPHAPLPFTPQSPERVLQVDRAAWVWLREAAVVGYHVTLDFILRVVGVRNSSGGRRANIHYGSERPGKRLDVYTPYPFPPSSRAPILSLPPSASGSSPTSYPIIVFFPAQTQLRLVAPKFVYSSLGYNVSCALNAVVVIPDLTWYPEGRVRDEVEDARRVLRWVEENARKFGGDPSRVFLMGHGLGAHLGLLLPLQEAIGKSREEHLESLDVGAEPDLPNGVLQMKVYASKVKIPTIQGLILLAPITNIDEHITDEAAYGIHHLSPVRRFLGPGEKTCFFHSPAHLLYAARNVLNPAHLPPRVLFMHGAQDTTVNRTQSEAMKEFMRGIGVEDTSVRLYDVNHWGIVMSFMCDMEGPKMMDEVYAFVHRQTEH